jgi:hypothetical protein
MTSTPNIQLHFNKQGFYCQSFLEKDRVGMNGRHIVQTNGDLFDPRANTQI